jgi:hypothetical protein
MNQELRARLAAITLNEDCAEHPAELKRLREAISHSIVLLDGEAPIDRYIMRRCRPGRNSASVLVGSYPGIVNSAAYPAGVA